MPAFKLIVSDPKTGSSKAYELKDQRAQLFVGMKIGDSLDANVIGIDGRVKITGGSDMAGFPMRRDISGGGKKYALLTKGVGFRSRRRGEKRRKLVRGNVITEEIYQINAALI